MQTDRFFKISLIGIILLLALNCIKTDSSSISIPFIETKAKATVPAFLQVGKSYYFRLQVIGGDMNNGHAIFYNAKVTNIDKESGWVRVEWNEVDYNNKSNTYNSWINLNQVYNCHETQEKNIEGK